jgi:hypothetical protein
VLCFRIFTIVQAVARENATTWKLIFNFYMNNNIGQLPHVVLYNKAQTATWYLQFTRFEELKTAIKTGVDFIKQFMPYA